MGTDTGFDCDYASLPKNIYSGAYRAGHCQGIAADLKKGFLYYSFTTMLVKTDLAGTFVGSNLTRPCGWRLGNGCGQVFRSNGFSTIFR